MSEPRFQDQFAGVVRVQQIIVLALAGGCLMFAAVAITLNVQGAVAAQPCPVFTLVALAVPIAVLIPFFVVRVVLASQARRAALAIAKRQAEDSQRSEDLRSVEGLLQSAEIVRALLQGFQMRLIFGAALLEGAAFFLLILYMMEGNLPVLAAAAVLVLGILLQFPTRARVAAWILHQAELIVNDQQFPQP